MEDKIPEFLYKYRPINDHTLRMIRLSEAYFSSPEDLNDPFDCKMDIPISDSNDEIRNFIRKMIPEMQGIDINKLEELIKCEERIKKYRESVQEAYNKPGLWNVKIFCLSEKNDDLLMFSHYSEGHKGICLEFKIEGTHQFFDPLMKVDYCDQFPSINFSEYNSNNGIRVHLLSKLINWSYEREWRIVKAQDEKVVNFPEQFLTGIIFGCETPSADRDLIISVAKQRNHSINFYEAKKKKYSFALDIVKL